MIIYRIIREQISRQCRNRIHFVPRYLEAEFALLFDDINFGFQGALLEFSHETQVILSYDDLVKLKAAPLVGFEWLSEKVLPWGEVDIFGRK